METEATAKDACTHGDATNYRYGCRCEKCGAAKRAVQAHALAASPEDYHGTSTGYRYGCRCDDCKAAAKAVRRSTTAECGTSTKAIVCRCDKCRAFASAEKAAGRKKRLEEGRFTHGTEPGYSCGCRCSECKTAKSAAAKRRAAKK